MTTAYAQDVSPKAGNFDDHLSPMYRMRSIKKIILHHQTELFIGFTTYRC